MKLETIEELKTKAKEMKIAALKMCETTGVGYPSSSFSCAEILVALYYRIMNYDSKNPAWEDRDRFFMSKGHGTNVMYTILQDVGYFGREILDGYMRADGTIGVLSEANVPGVECGGGSLGIGFGMAVGSALGAKMAHKDYLTFALIGDGECMEGSIWEAAMLAGHHKLNNLVAFVDRNYLCKLGFTENILQLEPLSEKWEAFGWDAVKINGHSFEDILNTLHNVHSFPRKKPLMVIAETVKGNGIDYMVNKPLWHGQMPKGEQLKDAYSQLETGGAL